MLVEAAFDHRSRARLAVFFSQQVPLQAAGVHPDAVWNSCGRARPRLTSFTRVFVAVVFAGVDAQAGRRPPRRPRCALVVEMDVGGTIGIGLFGHDLAQGAGGKTGPPLSGTESAD